MEEEVLLEQEFLLDNGKSQGLDENLYLEVLDFLQSYQNIPAGEFGSIRVSFSKIIKSYTNDLIPISIFAESNFGPFYGPRAIDQC